MKIETPCEYSSGCLEKFKKHYSIRQLRICGEKAAANVDASTFSISFIVSLFLKHVFISSVISCPDLKTPAHARLIVTYLTYMVTSEPWHICWFLVTSKIRTVQTTEQSRFSSHLVGLFYRTIRMIDNGIKPVYVFDGKPPQMKSSELEKRQERRAEAQKNLEKAEEEGVAEDVNKFSRRLVKVTKQHNDECKELLKLMGVPYVEAPCEAEAQCAALVKAGKVYATATEDMDGLTFGSSVLLRHMTFSEARKMPIKEFHLNRVLDELGLNQEEFIDLCILLGCDYCESIKGIGPKKAFEYIKSEKCIENIIEKIEKQGKYKAPEDWVYKEARELFKNPDVANPETVELKWSDPDEEGLIKFLCGDKGFSEDRVKNGVKKLLKGRHGSTQGRLDSFFTVIPKTSTNTNSVKRKAEENGSAKKKGKATRGRGSGKRGK